MRVCHFLLPTFILLLVGCIPIPHEQQEAPEIHGVLLDRGQAVAGATVRLAVNPGAMVSDCSPEKKTTKTDASGRFSFHSTTYHVSEYGFGYRKDTWRVCLGKDDGSRAIWFGSGNWGGPMREDIQCDVAAAADAKVLPCKVITPKE